MAWKDTAPERNKRTSTAAWRKLRLAVLDRDNHSCRKCGSPANVVDHVIATSLGGSDDEQNLQSMCNACHQRKTSAEAAAARAARPSMWRSKEKHPGLVD